MPKMKVFVSGSITESGQLSGLHARLTKQGFSVTTGSSGSLRSRKAQAELQEAIENSDVVVVVVGKGRRQSNYVKAQLRIAQSLHKPIIQVRLDEVQVRLFGSRARTNPRWQYHKEDQRGSSRRGMFGRRTDSLIPKITVRVQDETAQIIGEDVTRAIVASIRGKTSVQLPRRSGSAGFRVFDSLFETSAHILDESVEPDEVEAVVAAETEVAPVESADMGDVAFTHFYPASMTPAKETPLHVYVHLAGLEEQVRKDFEKRKDFVPEDLHITEKAANPFKRGTIFTIVPLFTGAKVQPARADVRWEDDIEHIQFSVKPRPELKEGATLRGEIKITVDGMPVASLPVISKVKTLKRASKTKKHTCTRYKKLFISYSSKDRAVVQAIDRLYQKYPELETFIDYKVLQASDYWWPKIQEYIQQANAFQLFWSENSAASPNVEQEWRYALELKRPIVPIILEPRPKIPEELQNIHFQNFDSFVKDL